MQALRNEDKYSPVINSEGREISDKDIFYTSTRDSKDPIDCHSGKLHATNNARHKSLWRVSKNLGQAIISFSVFVSFCGLVGVPITIMMEFDGYIWYISLLVIPFLSLMTSICQLKAMCTNPGFMPMKSNTSKLHNIPECQICSAYKPFRCYHCSVCQRCIYKMDHHCPWINNCIGFYNLKHFLLFLMYTFVYSTYCLIHCHVVIRNCPASNKKYPTFMLFLNFPFTRIGRCGFFWMKEIFCLLTYFFSLFFALFSLIMLISQLSAVYNNITAVETLKSFPIQRRPIKAIFSEIFSSSFSWKWLFPIDVQYFDLLHNFSKYEQVGILLYELQLREHPPDRVQNMYKKLKLLNEVIKPPDYIFSQIHNSEPFSNTNASSNKTSKATWINNLSTLTSPIFRKFGLHTIQPVRI